MARQRGRHRIRNANATPRKTYFGKPLPLEETQKEHWWASRANPVDEGIIDGVWVDPSLRQSYSGPTDEIVYAPTEESASDEQLTGVFISPDNVQLPAPGEFICPYTSLPQEAGRCQKVLDERMLSGPSCRPGVCEAE